MTPLGSRDFSGSIGFHAILRAGLSRGESQIARLSSGFTGQLVIYDRRAV